MAKYISKFKAEELDSRVAAVPGKHGASHFDPASNTMYYFASKEDKAEWESTGNTDLIIDEAVMNFTGTMYQVKVQSEMPSKNLFFTTKEEKAEITVSFSSQKKGITDVSWQDIVEDYNVSVYVDKGSVGTFEPYILDQFVMSGKTFTFDVKKVLATGVNRVRVVAVGSESADKAQGSEMFIVNLTSMYLAPSNFTWYKPFIEGDTYSLGGVNIGGNLSKVLKVKVSKEGYEKLYEVNIGSDIYTTTAYVFKGMQFPEAGTGVYNVELWLDANGLESEHLSYNIICVSQADRFTAQLVAIGSPAKVVYNFSDNKLFEYSIYNGGTATGSPHIKVSSIVNTNPTVLINEDLVDVATASPLTYTASLEIEMEDESATLQLEAFMTYGNEQQIIYPVDNSKSYPATTGAVFYMNPSARNNAQENREKVINSITGAEIDAVFTRMAWTDGTDGWTTDEEGRKCLRLPAGCTMDLAYQPLASVSQKTIELVYKVKNAADYDEPIFYIGDVYKEGGVKEEKDYNIEFVQGAYFNAASVGQSAKLTSNTNLTYTKPVLLKAGEKIVMQTQGTGLSCICQTDENASYYKALVISSNDSGYVDAEYTATEDMYVALSSRNVAFNAFQPYVVRLVAVQEEFNPNFRGIVIRPKNILIHSRDLNVNDSLQDYNTTDEETLHVLITIIPNYKTNYGNLAQIYVNGTKVRSFSFETADRWDVAANMKFGSETADTYWYKARVYDRGFEKYDAAKNYINSLPSTAEKETKKAEIEAPLDDSYNLSYDECVKNGLNTMVIEILDQDQTVPSIANPSAKQCNLWVNIHNPEDGELDEDFARLFSGEKIENQTIEGQGTTAMTYARWNFRWKLTSAYNKRRITAKKNFASSMHSHKMGATRLFNDLNRAIVGANDADARVAVYQYPVYGFQKIRIEGTEDYMYEPIGLYTIGPDKGDKTTFGFNGEYEDTLIHLEGTDHTPKGVGMDYPWEELAYSGSAEALGAVNASGSVVAAWEVGAAGEYDPKDNPTEVKAMLDAEFKPAYDVAEKNSTYILGVTETLAEINADIASWQAKTDAEGRSYATLEFFTDGVYDLYFYNARTQQYAPRGINMLTDLGVSVDGLTLDEKTELFKTKRRERFVANWETYWHKNDAIFHYAFVLIFAATDNFKKNTYPYKYKPFSEGGVYRWRQDDLDTLFDINNQGLAAKIYSILVGDKTDTGSGSIYRGDTSVFWTLIKECFPTEVKAMVHAIFDKMVELCPASYGKNTLDKLVGCVRYYFWDKAQAYFPSSAYNADAEWTYEDTWAAGLYKEVNPLSQSLGGHYEAERDWVIMRVLFTAMYYNYGPFGAVNDSFSDTSTGQIAYGGAGAHTFAIEMACDGNPTILRGQSELVTAGRRVKAGDIVEITVPDSSGADTRIYIQGVDWMKAVGDLSTLQVSADNPTLSLASKRMQNFKIGDEDASKVTTNVQGLTFGDCPSMMIVDARNASSLTGSIDLSKMPRLLEAYFGGTAVKSVNVPNGSKIVVLQIGEETTQVSLMNLKFMEGDGFQYTSLPKLEFVRIENCSQLSPFQLLKSIYNTDGNVIRDIRVIGFDVEGDASDVAMIANMANDVDKDGNEHIYNGIDAEGKPMDNSHPVIEGKLSINGNIYEDDYAALKAVFPNLDLSFLGFYLKFADPEVLRILLENITTDDGVGLTTEDIEGVTSISTWFKGNTIIESFNELERFTGLTSLNSTYDANSGPFNGCTSLKSVPIPSSVTYIGGGAFQGCTVLEYVGDLSNVETLHNSSFSDTPALVIDVEMPKLTSMLGPSFLRSGITKFSAPLLQTIPAGTLANNGAFASCVNLTEVDIPLASSIGKAAFASCTLLSKVEIDTENCTLIGDYAFQNCTSLAFDELNLPNLTTLGKNAFDGVKIKKLNLGKVTTLPSADTSTQNYGDKSVLEEVVLGEGLTNIGLYGFYAYKVLTKCVVPTSVTKIGNQAFLDCSSLENVGSLESITSIGDQAFNRCSALTKDFVLPNVTTINRLAFSVSGVLSVEMPNVTTIGQDCFMNCKSMTRLDIGDKVTSISSSLCSGCSVLKSLVCRAATPPTIGNNIILNAPNAYIYVPDASVDAYKSATNWSTYADRIYPLSIYEAGGLENVIAFEDSAVEAICLANYDTDGNGVLTKNEAEAVTSLGTTFKGNTEIVSFNELREFVNVKTLTSQAFLDCSSLATVDMTNVTHIEQNVFNGASALNGNFIAPNLESVSALYAFQNAAFTKYVNMGKLTTIPDNLWMSSNKNVECIIIPETVTSIGKYQFYGGYSGSHLWIMKSSTPCTVSTSNWSGSNKYYVPDAAVDTYKAASGWSTWEAKIFPISQLATDNPTLYAEIEEYL